MKASGSGNLRNRKVSCRPIPYSPPDSWGSGLLLYEPAVSILGASGGAAFPALCPAMTAVLAIPILGEWPTSIDWIAIISISVGVYVVSGGPLPGRRT